MMNENLETNSQTIIRMITEILFSAIFGSIEMADLSALYCDGREKECPEGNCDACVREWLAKPFLSDFFLERNVDLSGDPFSRFVVDFDGPQKRKGTKTDMEEEG